MLTARIDLKPIPPPPFSREAVHQLFDDIRRELGLPPGPPLEPEPARWAEWSRRAGAEPVEF